MPVGSNRNDFSGASAADRCVCSLLPEFRWAAGSQATHRLAHLLGNFFRIGLSYLTALDGTSFWYVMFGILARRE